ncbi:MAG: rhodanese [Flammeovirgaceae bacterium]|nr:rhodanese [Flammeovirgaceae bacterium]|tara:strand:+ start:54 stop:377 length:324 start_codon:yes stop_codon:yes gene_type:complete
MFSFFKKQYKSITALEFNKLKNERGVNVIDVRNKTELSSGMIPNSTHINVLNSSFKSEIKKLDQSKTYVVYCRSGIRSARACQIMGKLGFQDVYNLKGGILTWNELD